MSTLTYMPARTASLCKGIILIGSTTIEENESLCHMALNHRKFQYGNKYVSIVFKSKAVFLMVVAMSCWPFGDSLWLPCDSFEIHP